MIGTCRFCGQTKIVDDRFTEGQANAEATSMCNCPEGKIFRQNIKTLKLIYDICTKPAKHSAFNPMTEEESDNIVSLASCIADGIFDKAVVTQGDNRFTMVRDGKGVLKFSRQKLVEIGV